MGCCGKNGTVVGANPVEAGWLRGNVAGWLRGNVVPCSPVLGLLIVEVAVVVVLVRFRLSTITSDIVGANATVPSMLSADSKASIDS